MEFSLHVYLRTAVLVVEDVLTGFSERHSKHGFEV
jgi:hypothetical protein